MPKTPISTNPKTSLALLLTLLTLLLTACSGDATPTPSGPAAVHLTYNFSAGDQSWISGFSDYPAAEEQTYYLNSGIRNLPRELNPSTTATPTTPTTGYYIYGTNHSDDLFMFLKRHLTTVEGIQPSTNYTIAFTITFASNVPGGCVGIGGSPGEAVTLKAGATNIEPSVTLKDGTYTLNVDKGYQSTGGPAADPIGDISNGSPCEGDTHPYVSLTKTHTTTTPVQSSPSGDLWLLIGTDSGFEGSTGLYYQQIEVTLQPR